MEIIVNEIYNAMEKRAAVESKVAPLHNFNFKMRKVSEWSERALRKTSIRAMNPAKWLQT